MPHFDRARPLSDVLSGTQKCEISVVLVTPADLALQGSTSHRRIRRELLATPHGLNCGALLNPHLSFDHSDSRSFDSGTHFKDGSQNRNAHFFRSRIEMTSMLFRRVNNDVSAIDVNAYSVSRPIQP